MVYPLQSTDKSSLAGDACEWVWVGIISQRPAPSERLCILSGHAPSPAPPLLGIVIQPWLGDQPLFDLGPVPCSPPGTERFVTNQRSRIGLRLLKPRPPSLILIASVQQPQSHAARPRRCFLRILAPLSTSSGRCLFAFENLISSPGPVTLSLFLLGLQYAPQGPRTRRPKPWDPGSRSTGVRHPDLRHLN